MLGGLGIRRSYAGRTVSSICMLALTVQGFIGSFFMIGIPFLLPVSIRALDDAILGMAGCFKVGKANSSKAGNSQRNTGNVQFPVFFLGAF